MCANTFKNEHMQIISCVWIETFPRQITINFGPKTRLWVSPQLHNCSQRPSCWITKFAEERPFLKQKWMPYLLRPRKQIHFTQNNKAFMHYVQHLWVEFFFGYWWFLMRGGRGTRSLTKQQRKYLANEFNNGLVCRHHRCCWWWCSHHQIPFTIHHLNLWAIMSSEL